MKVLFQRKDMRELFQRDQGKSWVKVPVPPGTKQGFTEVWIDELASLPEGLLDGVKADGSLRYNPPAAPQDAASTSVQEA